MTSVVDIGRKINAQVLNYKWRGNQLKASDEVVTRNTLRDRSFDAFAKQAYASKEGYAIRVNPTNGQKEMFVAGTRNVFDWAANLAEVKYKGKLFYRKRAVAKYQKIAKANGVDVIYGHSRGGALVGDIVAEKGTRKVGLDAATIISGDKRMPNYRQGGFLGTFDRTIGFTGKNQKIVKSKRFHKVWK